MAYCTNCGAKLPKDAAFCPNCGTKTTKTATQPSDEMKEAFTRMSQELEKAFNIAAKEIQEAFQTARENYKEPVVCQNCEAKNPSDAVFCSQCGKNLQGEGGAEAPQNNV